LPEEWLHKPGQVEGTFYFESPDESQGAYFSGWRTKGQPLRTLITNARASERRNLPGGGNWVVFKESESDTESQIDLVSTYFNGDAKYLLTCRLLGREDFFLRLTVHDYGCEDPTESLHRSSPWVNSLTLCEPGHES
jgi:hypothetical protein